MPFTMIISMLETIIGALPEYTNYGNNYEIVRYVIAGTVLIFMLSLGYRLINDVFFGLFKIK